MIKPHVLAFAVVATFIGIQMGEYGWAESLFYYGFPFSPATPLRMHYVTLLVSITSMALAFTYYHGLGAVKALILSGLFPVVGLSGFEAMWHYGWLLPEEMKPAFWIVYFATATMLLSYLKRNWAASSTGYLLAFAVAYTILFITWLIYAGATGFYPSLLLYEAGNGANPHGVTFFTFKASVLLLPLMLLEDER